jgi:hypothetical protein
MIPFLVAFSTGNRWPLFLKMLEADEAKREQATRAVIRRRNCAENRSSERDRVDRGGRRSAQRQVRAWPRVPA